MLDEVEKNLNLPTLSIQFVDKLRREADLKDIGHWSLANKAIPTE